MISTKEPEAKAPPPSFINNRILVIDGWKGYSIIGIILGHIIDYLDIDIINGVNYQICIYTSNLIMMYVLIFFVIAGINISKYFVSDSSSAYRILTKRAARLIPQFILLPLLAILIFKFILPPYEHYYEFYMGKTNPAPDYLVHFLSPKASQIFYLDHTWFLTSLIYGYIFAIIILMVMRRFFRDNLSSRIGMLACVVASLIIIRIMPLNEFQFRSSVYYIMEPLMLGVMLGVLLKHIIPSFSESTRANFYGYSLVIGVAIFIFITYDSPFNVLHPPTKLSFLYIPLAMMVTFTYSRGPIVRALFENRVIVAIGKSSLGIYLFHFPYRYPFLILKGYIASPWLLAVLFVLSSVIIGMMLERFTNKLMAMIPSAA